MAMRFSVESWSPEYGVAADADLFDDGSDRVDATVERALDRWAPIVPSATTMPATVLFVDGVRRVDARIWIHGPDRVYAGVCASVAAGVVACRSGAAGGATVEDVRIGRVLVARAATAASPVGEEPGRYEVAPAVSEDPNAVYAAIHGRMTALEQGLAAGHEGELVVFDGPLRGRSHPHGVGYVKTHQVQYLPEQVVPVLARLGDGERTPLFLIGDGGTGLARWSWYLRLPGPRTQPLAGVVRCELPGTSPVVAAIARAELISGCLPRFASRPHREPRAPQNLSPIAGLEQRLRHLLGDRHVLERRLRRAAAAEAVPVR